MENQNLNKKEKILNGFLEKYNDCNPLFIIRNFDKLNSFGKVFDNLEDLHSKNNLRWNSDFALWEEVELQESKVVDIINNKNASPE